MIKIIIADDHRIVRDGLRSLLSSESDITILAEASDGEDALVKTRELKPDILIADISMPTINGIEMTKILSQENLNIPV
jgi:two-component system invasion response regulator UvrY